MVWKAVIKKKKRIKVTLNFQSQTSNCTANYVVFASAQYKDKDKYKRKKKSFRAHRPFFIAPPALAGADSTTKKARSAKQRRTTKQC